MSIFNIARNLFAKPYLKRKLRKEIDKLDDTIKEMLVYESINDYVREIAEYSKNNGKEGLIIEVLTSDNVGSKNLKKIVCSKGYLDFYQKIKDSTIEFSDEETILVKKMLSGEYKRPKLNEIRNLAFSGGGAKGIAHVGTLRKIAELDLNIKAVSGTSAGAITALPYALGYRPSKVANIVNNYDFTSFLQESTLHDSLIGDVVTKISPSKRALMYRTVYFDEFVKELETPLIKYLIKTGHDRKSLGLYYGNKEYTFEEKMVLVKERLRDDKFPIKIRRLLSGKKINNDLKSVVEACKEKAEIAFFEEISKNNENISLKEQTEKLNLGFSSPSDALKTFFRIYRKEDVIEEFFGDLIEHKLMTIPSEILEKVKVGFSRSENIRKMTFKDFEKLRKLCPDEGFKDIGICICQKIESGLLHTFDKENYKQIDVHSKNTDPEYSEMPIKTAVRISMNLPGAFSSYEYKGKKYVDGGVRANFPLHFFDKTQNRDRSRTLGFALAPEDNYTRTKDVNNLGKPETPVDFLEPSPFKRVFKRILNNFSHYYNYKVYGAKLDNNKPMDSLDLLRVGFINVLGIGTNDFNISRTEKLELMQQGYNSCSQLLSKNYQAQVFHYRERVKAIYNKIDKLKEHPLIEKKEVDEIYNTNYNNILEYDNDEKIQSILSEKSGQKRQKFTKNLRRKA